MADRPSNNRAAEAACVEDYNDESETAVPETRKTANITAKRSKPDVPKPQAARDEISDSGHSSQTLATLGSTNSSLASKSASDTIRADSHAAIGKTRTLKVEEKHQSKSRSPEKSQSRRATSTNRKDGFAKAGSATPHHPTKPAAKARAPGPDLKQQKKHNPVHFAKEVPIPQNAPPRPRARSHRRERPLSFHAGAAPEHFYSQLIEPQPTVRYGPIASIVTPSYSPHPNSYFPSEQPIHQPQAPPLTPTFYPSPSSPFEPPARPRPRQWTSDFSHPPRPQSMIYTTTPIYEYVAEPVYPPILPPMQPPSRQSSHRERLRALPELRTARGEDCYTMPPPAPPPPPRPRTGSEQGRRPAIRHAATADIHSVHAHRRAVRDESTTGHVGRESPVKQSYGTHESAPRPRRNTSDETVPSTHGAERRTTHIERDAAKHRQQASVYGHESSDKLEESKAVEAVERYQASKGNRRASSYGAMPPPTFTRKKTHTSSKSSETSSRKSGKSGKSRTSRTSKDESDLKSRRTSGDDYFSMRVDASQGVNVDLKGGMEGRRITLRHHKDEGEMEFTIGGAQGRTTTGPERESREKSRRRYSYRDGPSEVEIDRPGATSRLPMKIREKEEGDETEPRIVQERTTTTTRTRARSLRDTSRVREE